MYIEPFGQFYKRGPHGSFRTYYSNVVLGEFVPRYTFTFREPVWISERSTTFLHHVIGVVLCRS